MDKEIFAGLAALNKLRFTPEEEAAAGAYFDFAQREFQALGEAEADDLEPMVFVAELSTVLRPDEARKTISREAILACAPEEKDGAFQVPAVLD